MNHRAIVISICLFVVIVTGMFGFAYLKKAEIAKQQEAAQTNNTQQQTPVPYADITVITAKHYFIDGVHTLVGEIPMPTPCDLLDSKAQVAQSLPQQITVDFSVINTATSCEQKITNQRFQVQATASKDAPIKAFFMGRPVELNIIPAAPGEKPEDFELFIKG